VPVAEDSGELRVDGVRGEPSLGASACVDGGPWSTVPIEADDAGAFSLAIDIPAGATRAALRFEAGGRQDKERVIR
jgi:hypothetical protein